MIANLDIVCTSESTLNKHKLKLFLRKYSKYYFDSLKQFKKYFIVYNDETQVFKYFLERIEKLKTLFLFIKFYVVSLNLNISDIFNNFFRIKQANLQETSTTGRKKEC